MLAVDDLLDDPLLAGARRLTESGDLSERKISWFSVIEGPVEDFVERGDLVMTSGLGCDADQFSDLIADVSAADPAGIFVAVPEESAFEEIPPPAVKVAETAGVPLVEIPWRLRFAEIARLIVDRLASAQDKEEPIGVGPVFVAALLEEHGVGALAGIAESLLADPVIVLGPDLRVDAAGPIAQRRFAGRLAELDRRVDAFSAAEVLMLRSMLENPETVEAGLARIGLPSDMTVARAMRRSGYVLAGADSRDPSGPADAERRELLKQAAHACALEQMRARSIAESEARAQGDLLWAVARGDIVDPAEIARRAALLGHPVKERYAVAVGIVAPGPADVEDVLTLDAVTLPRLRSSGARVSRREEAVLLVSAHPPAELKRILADAPGATWGVADAAVPLADLRDAHGRARDSAVAAVALGRRGTVDSESDLYPYLLLTRMGTDPASRRVVKGILGSLVDYDRRTSRDLIGTLEAYLAANGNSSAAARALHLNRHSLLYRLRKIESLTDCELDDPDDRFLLDLALRLRRLALVRQTTSSVPAVGSGEIGSGSETAVPRSRSQP